MENSFNKMIGAVSYGYMVDELNNRRQIRFEVLSDDRLFNSIICTISSRVSEYIQSKDIKRTHATDVMYMLYNTMTNCVDDHIVELCDVINNKHMDSADKLKSIRDISECMYKVFIDGLDNYNE